MSVALSVRNIKIGPVATGVITVPVVFPVADPARDLAILRKRGAVTAELTAVTDWTWTPATAPTPGGTVTILSGLAGDLFVVKGDYPLQRLANLSRANINSAKALNAEFDRLWMSLQELASADADAAAADAVQDGRLTDLESRAIRVATGQEGLIFDRSMLAGKVLAADASGALVGLPVTPSVGVINATQIIDSTPAGRSMLQAANAAAQRTLLGLDQLASLSYREPSLTSPNGVGGLTKSVPLVALLKGGIKLAENYTIVEGEGIGLTAAQNNRNEMFRAFNEASSSGREILLPDYGMIEVDAVTSFANRLRIVGNNCTIRSMLTGASSSSVLYMRPTVMTGSDRLRLFECRDVIFDLNGHLRSGAGSGGYCLAVVRSADTIIDNCAFLNPYSGAAFFQDDYGPPPRPATVSTNLVFINNDVVRTDANLAAYGTNALMRQGDQVAIVGIRNVLIDGNTFVRSGRSGVSLGMNQNKIVSNNRFSNCWASIYIETLERAAFINNFIEGHEHFNGDPIQQTADPIINDSYGVLIGDKDLTFPGLGYAAARDVIIDGLFISNVSRAETTGAFRGLSIGGRNGTGLGATGITARNIVGRGIGGGTDTCLVSVRGQVSNTVLRDVFGTDVPIVARVDEPYTTFGGAPANLMDGVWIDNLNAQSAGYAVKTANGGGAHVRSGIRNSNFGGCNVALPPRDRFMSINNVR